VGFGLAIVAPDGKGYAVGGGWGALLNQHGFGGNCHPHLDSDCFDFAQRSGCVTHGLVVQKSPERVAVKGVSNETG
jgi:hypothetical protein